MAPLGLEPIKISPPGRRVRALLQLRPEISAQGTVWDVSKLREMMFFFNLSGKGVP